MRRALSLFAVFAGAALFAGAAAASCLPTKAAAQRAAASVIFDGVALEGPTATGVQRFRVRRYLKGGGPTVVRVATGVVRHADGRETLTSISLVVRRGEHWRIYGRGSAMNVVQSNGCSGSKRR